MPTNIDELQIEINANATKANQAIDRLVTKLNGLSASLSKLNTSSLTGLANGVNRLGSAMQTMNTVKTSDFTRLANNVQKLGNINVQSLNSAASSMSHLTRAFNNLGSVSANAMQVGDLARNISRLGNASVQRAITNIPQLATSLNQLMSTLSRAPRVSANVIQMTQALANLANQGSRVGSASRSMVNGLNSTNTAMLRARKSTFSLASAFGRFYATYFLVIRGLKKLWSSISSTADYFESFNYFNVAFEKVSSEWNQDYEKYGYENAETYANSFTERMNETFSKLSGVQINTETMTLEETGLKNLGFNIQQITQFASQLASVTNSVGMTGEASLATADSFTKLAGDMSSLFNTDYETAMTNLQSGLIGQSRALYKYGIDITNATLQTKAYELGLTKAVSEMTQGEKMQLRLLSILEQSKVAWGDQANTINTTSNMIRQLKNNLSEAGMVLGQLFLPILQKVLPVLNGITIAIKRLLGDIASLFGIKFEEDAFSTGYNETEETLDGISDSLDDVTESAKKAKAGLRGFDELQTISMPDTSTSTSSGVSTIDLTDEILKATEKYSEVWQEAYDKMENRAEKFADRVEKALAPVKKLFKDLSIGDYFAVGEDVSNIVSGINNFFTKAIEKTDWSKIGRNIGEFLAGIDWAKVISSGIKLRVSIWKLIADTWIGTLSAAPLETSIITAIGLLKFTKLGSKLKKIVTPIVNDSLSKIKPKIKPWAISIAVASVAIEVAKNKLEPIWEEYTFEEIREASEQMFSDWFGKNPLSLSLSDTFITVSSAIVDLPSVIEGISLMFDDIASGDFKFNFANLVEFPSANELSDAWALMFDDAQKAIEDGMKEIDEYFEELGSAWALMFDDAEKNIEDSWKDVVDWWNEDVSKWWDNDVAPWFSKEKWDGIVKNIKTSFEEGWGKVEKWWNENALSKWWDKNVKPWFDGDTWLELFTYVKEDFKDGWESVKEWWSNSALSKWWEEDVAPWFTKEKWTSLLGNIKTSFEEKWNEVVTWWDSTALGNWWNSNVLPWFTKEKWLGALSGIKDAFTETWEAAMSGIKEIWNKFANFLNEKLTFEIQPIEIAGKKIFDGANINLGKIPTFATGGFPEDGLFMANRGELVGEFSDGRTAVANNDQITKGIADAVYPAVYNAVVSAMSNSSSNQNVNVTLQGDVNKIFRAVQDESRSYTRRTGKPAFN